MSTQRIVVGGVVVALATTTLLLGGTLRERAGVDAQAVAAAQLERRDPAVATKATIATLQQRLRSRPRDAESLSALGMAYQQRARETGDPTYLTQSEGVLERALQVAPQDAGVVTGLASLALARHEFGRALRLGRRAVALSPESAAAYGAVGDALVELGRYDEAFAAFDAMAARRPDVASYARVSYGRELLGRTDAAVAAMQLAADAAGGQPEPFAWSQVQLGKLEFGRGRLRRAESHYTAALAAFPDFPYALDGLARVEAARGHDRRAVELGERAVAAAPLPEFVATLADVERAAGRTEAARRHVALVDAIASILRANGVRSDLELARFDVDHGRKLPQALAAARRGYADRPSITAADTLAWALARNGRCAEARVYSERSLRLGTRSAELFFHRGMIDRCLGRSREAREWFRRALATNPHFSPVWSPVARRYAR